ncbi:MAG: hypothetical protein F6K48_10800 [Okeania sp. SIO3H1]|nr:hypothetical protein [Okeania sp. SIO3H1]
MILQYYSAFQIDEPHLHTSNPVGTFHGTSLLWSTQMKSAIICKFRPAEKTTEGRRKKEEGRRKREEGRGKNIALSEF